MHQLPFLRGSATVDRMDWVELWRSFRGAYAQICDHLPADKPSSAWDLLDLLREIAATDEPAAEALLSAAELRDLQDRFGKARSTIYLKRIETMDPGPASINDERVQILRDGLDKIAQAINMAIRAAEEDPL